MADPLTIAATIKEVAESAALLVKETLKLSEVSELIKQIMGQHKIKELNNVKDLLRNPTEELKAIYRHLFNEIKKAKANPELRASLINRFLSEPIFIGEDGKLTNIFNLIGQSGEFHAHIHLKQYGNFKWQVEKGAFRVDFVGKLDKDMPIETVKIIDGKTMTVSEVIPAGEKIGVEVKNGLSELIRNPEHIINQAQAAKELTGNGFIGISESMLEDIVGNPEIYSNFFEKAAENDIRIIVTHPTKAQQIANLLM